MIQNLRQIKLRIRSVSSTRRITRAMEMVSAAKLNRVKNIHQTAVEYFDELDGMFRRLHSDRGAIAHPLTEERFPVKTIALVIITSDTGLCGSYNHNVLKTAEEFISDHKEYNIELIAVGKEAHSHFKDKGIFLNNHFGLYGRYSEDTAKALTNEMVKIYTSEEADEIYIAYTKFSSSLRHMSVVEKFLNVDWGTDSEHDHIYEPSPDALFDSMLKEYLLAKIRAIILESFTAEHSARMLAMKTATDNADELIDKLTMMRNKARQFAITKEVLEIAMSAEALR
jgi:F-type H+-transporting ATPase subunit gamma